MKKLMVLLLLLLSGCASICTGGWTKTDTALELVSMGLLAEDMHQTNGFTVGNDKGYYEMNPLIGHHPTHQMVNTWFISWIVFHPVVSCALPPTARHIWQGVTIVTEAPTILHNKNLTGAW